MNIIERVTGVVVTAIFSSFVLLTFLQVILRYGFSNSLGWIDEYSRYGFIWVVALTAAIATRRGLHIAITFVDGIPGGAPRRIFAVIGDLGMIAFALLIGLGGWQLVGLNWTSLTPALQIPIAYVQLVLPIFAVLTLLFSVENMIGLLRGEAEPGDRTRVEL